MVSVGSFIRVDGLGGGVTGGEMTWFISFSNNWWRNTSFPVPTSARAAIASSAGGCSSFNFASSCSASPNKERFSSSSSSSEERALSSSISSIANDNSLMPRRTVRLLWPRWWWPLRAVCPWLHRPWAPVLALKRAEDCFLFYCRHQECPIHLRKFSRMRITRFQKPQQLGRGWTVCSSIVTSRAQRAWPRSAASAVASCGWNFWQRRLDS